MSSYFDRFDALVARSQPANTEEFLTDLKRLEAPMIRTCELLAGDRETPQDVREAIISCILTNEVLYDGGDFLGGKVGGLLLPSKGAQFAAVMRRSLLSQELHSLFHRIAERRIRTRYGLIMDNPEYAVAARDRYAEERFGGSKDPG